jgi:hypothetical protein
VAFAEGSELLTGSIGVESLRSKPRFFGSFITVRLPAIVRRFPG